MLCQRCKKNIATEHITDIINGEKFESHLCAKCSAEVSGGLHEKLSDEICAWLFGSPEPKKVCPVCGTTYKDYERTGLLGCASCYDVFKEELLPVINAIQGRTEHVGKVESNNDEHGLYRQLKGLQEQLELAMRERRYQDAGRLNQRIYEINKKLFGGEQ